MSINFKVPESIILKPVITVFGIGGAGGNAVNNMITENLQGANFVVANTDAQSLEHSLCTNRIQLGAMVTKGLGAGASPEVGALAAQESASEIMSYLEGSNMVFITAGMGGGTGTGASPEVAKIAKELGLLTVGVVTKPFNFEGKRRMITADEGVARLQKYVDTLIVIPNQNLFRIANDRTTFADAFKMADSVLHAGVRGVTDLMIMPGLINLDFADIRAVMSAMGKAMMGTGEASGEDRAVRAAEAAISNPLLAHNSMGGAKGVLINITGGRDMTLFEVDLAANRVREEVGDSDANIIFGSTFNAELDGIIRVSVVATGIDADSCHLNIKTSHQVQPEQQFEEEVPHFESYAASDGAAASNSYQEEVITEEVETQQNIDNSRFDEPIEEVTIAERSRSETVSQESFLSKMWNSLKATDKPNTTNHHEQLKNVTHNQPSINTGTSNIHEIPAFLRKHK